MKDLRRKVKTKLHHEHWPTALFYTPVFAYYLYQSLRLRKLNYINFVNPEHKAGGLFGFSKRESLESLAPRYLPKTVYLSCEKNYSPETLRSLIEENKMNFPLILKPDRGERGFLVEKVQKIEDINRSLKIYGKRLSFLLQEYVDEDLELGVFFIRENSQWKISSLTSKSFLKVKGDGRATLLELLERSPRAQKYFLNPKRVGASKSHLDFKEVLPKGKELIVENIGNHCRGTKFVDESARALNGNLLSAFEDFLRPLENLNYFRLDLRTPSWEELQKSNFKVLELNGISSEPGHIYDPKVGTLKAYRDLISHWSDMAKVAERQMQYELKVDSFSEVLKEMKSFFRQKKEIQSEVLEIEKERESLRQFCETNFNLKSTSLLLDDVSTQFDFSKEHWLSEADLSEKYERASLFKNEKFELILCKWHQGSQTSKHVHPQKQCWFKCLSGQLLEEREASSVELTQGKISYIEMEKEWHQVKNTSETSFSLHIYKVVK